MKFEVLLVAILLVVPQYGFGQLKEKFTPTFKVTKKTTHKIPKKQEYTFGYLSVLENRSDPSSRIIEFPVYIFKSRNPNPKPDPIIYTVGGPGSTTMPSAPYMNFYKYLDDRDFILVEQRGNYYAKPHLDCPEWSMALQQANQFQKSNEETNRLLKKAALQCRKRLTDKGIDLNGYNTHEIAADIADLVETLEIKEYNLLTISYSTKIAQVLLRDFPEKIRSVVMDSALPLEVNYDEESVGNMMASLDLLLSDCEKQDSCRQAYPNLKKRLKDYLIDKSNNPLKVKIINPNTNEEEHFKLGGKDLITIYTSASTGDIPNIPFEINRLLLGDLSTVKEQLSNLFEAPGSGAGIGMRLSVWCSEEYPFVDQSIIAKETIAYPEVTGLSPAVFDSIICNAWSVAAMPPLENEPIQSDVPVLLINGSYDNATPSKWANNMQSNLSNSYHLIFEGWTHTPTTNWGNQCAMVTANAFFNNPTKAPEPKCFKDITGVYINTRK